MIQPKSVTQTISTAKCRGRPTEVAVKLARQTIPGASISICM